MVDADRGTGQTGDLIASDERAPTGSDRAQLGHGFTVAGDDKRLARCYGLDDLCILIA